jgi:hypothetical protein
VRKALEEADGVAAVTVKPAADGLSEYEVRTHHDRDLRESLYQRVASHKDWSLRRLDLRRPKLEDHYARTVLRSPAAEASAN